MDRQRARAMAEQIVRDVIAARGPGAGEVFRMYAVEPEDMPAHRVVLARRYARMVPRGVTLEDVPVVAAGIVPLLIGQP